MRRSNFIKSLIGIPFIGAIASDLVAKESVKEVASISIPKITSFDELAEIKNPVIGQLYHKMVGENNGLYCYYDSGWKLLATRSFTR